MHLIAKASGLIAICTASTIAVPHAAMLLAAAVGLLH